MPQATLMFGLGATKAGTSWLYRYLFEHPDCHLRHVKELHYFDGPYALDRGQIRQRALQQGRGLLKKKSRDYRDYSRLFRIGTDEAYLDYLFRGSHGAKLVGDITPAYAVLPRPTLKRMANLTDDVRFLYLLRDPVERLWSHARMNATSIDKPVAEQSVEERSLHIVEEVLSGERGRMTAISDYECNLRTITSVVPKNRLYVGFFEEMFSQHQIGKLCEFLGISYVPAKTKQVVHGGSKVDLPSHLRMKVRDFLAPQYNFVDRFMGYLPKEWQNV